MRCDADSLAQELGKLGRALDLRARHQHQELLAAEAIREIERAQLRAQHVGDVLEHLVADRVSVPVVDELEAVHIADDQPDRLAGDAGLFGELLHARGQRVTVEHAGQLVDHGVAAVLDVRIA